jgi:hypothetical protein
MTISQQAADVRARAREGHPGQWVLSSVSYTSDASATVAEIHAGLIAAVNAEPLMRGILQPGGTSPSLTLTGLLPGVPFTPTVTDGSTGDLGAPVNTAAAASAAAVPFGRAVVDLGYATGESDRLGALCGSTQFTAQVVTVTVAYIALTYYTVRIRDRQTGRIIADETVIANTDHATTAGDLETALNGALPASTVIATSPAADLVLTAEVPGYEFDVEVNVAEAAGTLTLVYTTGPSRATSLQRAFAGVSLHSLNDPNPTIGSLTADSYAANAGMRVAQQGQVWVEDAAGISLGDDVYVELAVGANTGKFYNAASATRVQLPAGLASWRRGGRDSTDNIAALELAAPL